MCSDFQADELKEIDPELYTTYCSTCKDVFNQHLKDQGLLKPLRRVILVGKLKYSNGYDVKTHHNKMAEKLQYNVMDTSSKLSGLMIIHGSYFYHIVEGSDDILNDVIDFTSKIVNENLINGAKVFRNSSIFLRYFDNWNSCTILSPTYKHALNEKTTVTTDNDISTLAEMIKKFEDIIFILASFVRYLKPNQIEQKINELLPTNVLPSMSELEDICKENFFLTVEKYVKRYLTPDDYSSYLEQEWPPTGPVHDAEEYFKKLERLEKSIDEHLDIEKEQKMKKARYGTWWWE